MVSGRLKYLGDLFTGLSGKNLYAQFRVMEDPNDLLGVGGGEMAAEISHFKFYRFHVFILDYFGYWMQVRGDTEPFDVSGSWEYTVNRRNVR